MVRGDRTDFPAFTRQLSELGSFDCIIDMVCFLPDQARNAVEAVPMLPDFRPDVILLDLRMPLLDGEAFLRGIRGLPASRDVPVVLISAKEELPAIATRYGAAGYLSKPFEAPQLLSLIERVLQ